MNTLCVRRYFRITRTDRRTDKRHNKLTILKFQNTSLYVSHFSFTNSEHINDKHLSNNYMYLIDETLIFDLDYLTTIVTKNIREKSFHGEKLLYKSLSPGGRLYTI